MMYQNPRSDQKDCKKENNPNIPLHLLIKDKCINQIMVQKIQNKLNKNIYFRWKQNFAKAEKEIQRKKN